MSEDAGLADWPPDFPYRPHLRFCSLGNENVAEVMESFRVAAARLGYTTSVEASASVDNADINLFFFAMGLSLPSDEELPLNSIVVNFEPALPQLVAAMPAYLRLLQRAWVWEYSLENLMHHRALGILRSDHVPLTFDAQATPMLAPDRVLDDAAQDIDVVFFGETTPRRLQVLRALASGGLRVAYPIGTAWTPAQRDALLPRAKVALNMRKADRTATVELPRLSILLRNRKAVVSELYPHSEIPAVLRDAIEGCTKDELVERVRALVADAPRRRALEKAGPSALLGLTPQHEVLDGALRRYLGATRQRLAGRQAAAAAAPAGSAAPEVSVLMVTRNDRACVAEALASMAAQTQAPRRIILVDDASTDGTVAVIRECIEAEPRLAGRVLLLEAPAPMGWAAAAQWGLSHARGDALALWSPHAHGMPNRLQVQSAFLRASPEVGAVGAWEASAEAQGAEDAFMSGRQPEMHAQIMAGMLVHLPSDRQPMLMGSLTLALPRVRRRGLGFDATLGEFAWMGLLIELVGDGACLANLDMELIDRRQVCEASPATNSAQVIALAHVRERVLALVFPGLACVDARRLARLYGQEWAPDASDATALLREIASACQGRDDAPAVTVLRGECLRVLDVYASNGRLAPGYTAALMREPLLRDFLAPLGARLCAFEPGATS